MPAAANGDEETVVAAEVHRRSHVGNIDAARDHQRMLVDHAIEELARLVVVGVAALDDWAPQAFPELTFGFVAHEVPPFEKSLFGVIAGPKRSNDLRQTSQAVPPPLRSQRRPECW